ncbi:hypothetical protein HK103_004766 [Boothiomyces macroporosus]|uniref:Acyltransferase 3 domain-containing protein n=1 Tax=Boothiomyces macroporosus TaxID=261099 RepID=A0AAD5ULZ9_9FUNG|nr:hypothetical protein HK103_004766 [Boothiomyces macroporosus]
MAEFNSGVNVLLNTNQPNVAAKQSKEPPKKPVVKDLPPTRATMIPCLSGMRGVAALSVVYLHLNSFSHGQMYMGGWDSLNEFGSMAVIFFFVLSAFLLTYRGLYDIKRESDLYYVTVPFYNKKVPVLSMRWISYFFRRFFRIYPIFIFIVIIATTVPRFQGDPLDTQPYYANFKTAAGLPPQSIYEYIFLINVQSIFWSIPPEIEYYFVIPFIITTFEAAQYADSVIFISKKEKEEMEAGNDPLAGLPFMERILKKFFRNLLYSVFRILHLIFWSYFSLPGVLDTYFWYDGDYNKNHLPPHYFRFWSGSFVAIILYWLEQNYLVPQPITKKEEESTERRQMLINWAKRIFFFLCDKVLWIIIFVIVSQTNWYQGNYFGQAIPNDPAWPATDWAFNSTYITFIKGYDLQFFDQRFTSTRLCSYTCAFIIFLICYGARNGSFSTFFTWEFFMYSGDVSFPVYLCHFIGIRESMRLWVDYFSETRLIQLDQNILALWLTLVIATLLHELIEKPCMKIGNAGIRYLRSTVFKPKPKPEKEEIETVAVETFTAPLPTFSDRVQPESLELLIEKRKSANVMGHSAQPAPSNPQPRNSYLELEGFGNQRSSMINEIFGKPE